jgi:hypothetical protein
MEVNRDWMETNHMLSGRPSLGEWAYLFLDVVERIWRIDGEANEDDM